MTRSMEVRLTEYRDMLLVTAGNIENVIEALESRDMNVGGLPDAVKLYRIIADDLTKIMNDEELPKWAVTGVLP